MLPIWRFRKDDIDENEASSYRVRIAVGLLLDNVA